VELRKTDNLSISVVLILEKYTNEFIGLDKDKKDVFSIEHLFFNSSRKQG
jgi:hypothetical protein